MLWLRRRILLILSMILIVAVTVTAALSYTHKDMDKKDNITTTEKQTTEKQTTSPPETTLPAPAEQKLIAFTFDDGPSNHTRYLIDEMNKRGMKATFFMLGQNAEKFPETIQYMYQSGHQLGSHTYDHDDIKKLANEDFMWQINKADTAISNAVGVIPNAFRPPFGSYSSEKIGLIDKTIVLWSLDTNDWRHKNEENGAQIVCDAIMNNVSDGSIVLMHDLYPNSINGALMAADQLLAQGYKFVTIDEILSRDGQIIEQHKPYSKGIPAK